MTHEVEFNQVRLVGRCKRHACREGATSGISEKRRASATLYRTQETQVGAEYQTYTAQCRCYRSSSASRPRIRGDTWSFNNVPSIVPYPILEERGGSIHDSSRWPHRRISPAITRSSQRKLPIDNPVARVGKLIVYC